MVVSLYQKKLTFVFGLHGQGYSAGSDPQKINNFLPYPEFRNLLQPNLCFVAVLDCYLQGQGHSKGSNPQGILKQVLK